MKEIFLPGLHHQVEFLLNNIKTEGFNILVVGPGTAAIADHLKLMINNVQIIVEDYDSLIETRLELNDKSIPVKIMEYEKTDFSDGIFDLIYAQASISSLNRNRIVKEVKRILKQDAYFCTGEIVKLNSDVPRFVSDIWDRAELLPLYIDDVEKYYSERKFDVIASEDFSRSLRKFYELVTSKLMEIKTGEESGAKKKALNLFSHERNAYLKLGGEKFMGFKILLLKKR